MLSAGSGCVKGRAARCRSAMGKFQEHVPMPTARALPLKLKGRLISSNIHSSMRHGPSPLILPTSYVEMIAPWFGGSAESGLLMSLILRVCTRNSVMKTSPYSFVDIDCDGLGMLSARPAKSVGCDPCI